MRDRSEEQPIRIVLIDDHPVFRQGLVALIETQADLVNVGTAGSGREGLAVVKTAHPDLVVLDLRLGDDDGLAVLERLRSLDPASRVLILTSHEGDVMVERALRAGATGYVSKNASPVELLNAFRQVSRGLKFVSRNLAAKVSDATGRPALTDRESEILTCVAAGLSNKEVADQLGLTEKTVKNHLNRIFTKLDAADRTHAVMIALDRGIITAPT